MKNSSLGKVLAGVAVGVGLGVLFAPKSGRETREDLKKEFDSLKEKLKNLDVAEVKTNISKKMKEIQDTLADMDKEKALDLAKEKYEVLKVKLKELGDLAKEKSTPIVEKSVESLREKALVVAEGVVEKLEKKK